MIACVQDVCHNFHLIREQTNKAAVQETSPNLRLIKNNFITQ